MISVFGYIWIGILIGAGIPYAFKVRKDWQREDREEALRDESWISVTQIVAMPDTLPAFEVVYPSRGA